MFASAVAAERDILDLGGLQALITVAAKYEASAPIAEAAAGALRNLTFRSGMKHGNTCFRIDSILTPVALLRCTHAGDSRLLVSKHGGVPVLLRLLEAHGDAARVQAAVLGALRNLALTGTALLGLTEDVCIVPNLRDFAGALPGATRDEIAKSCVGGIANAMARHASDAKVQEAGGTGSHFTA